MCAQSNAKLLHFYFQLSSHTIDVELGNLTRASEINDPDEKTREQLIKSHFALRIADLTNCLQTADSKTVHFIAEVRYYLEICECKVIIYR